jgi:uncharacterized protein (TIGR02145 family)
MEIRIKNQVWERVNCNFKVFQNGDPINYAASNEDWVKLSNSEKPAWCYYDNNPENENKFGLLYNWYAIVDERKIATDGWCVPNTKDWEILISNFGVYNNAGKHLKSATGWSLECNLGDNLSGFSAFPGGKRWVDGNFMGSETSAIFWAIDNNKLNDDTNNAKFATHYDIYAGDGIYPNQIDKRAGYSLRLLKNIRFDS